MALLLNKKRSPPLRRQLQEVLSITFQDNGILSQRIPTQLQVGVDCTLFIHSLNTLASAADGAAGGRELMNNSNTEEKQ